MRSCSDKRSHLSLWNDDRRAPTAWDVLADHWHYFQGAPRHVFDGLGLVPIVHMRVLARTIGATDIKSDANALDVTLPVGISFRPIALLTTGLLIFAAWALLLRWATYRNVRGGRILRIISNRYNYASLSQFQILLWTFVIGGGAVYVMVLTGSLIEIPPQALALLGISGFSALSAAIKSTQDANNPPPQASAPVSKTDDPVKAAVIRDPQAFNVRGTGTEAFLVWQPPTGGIKPVGYRIQWNPASAAGVQDVPAPTAQPLDVDGPCASVTGLTPGTNYTFLVATRGAAGADSDPVPISLRPVAAGTAPGEAVADLKTNVPQGGIAVELSWNDAAKSDRYLVQYRRAGQSAWLALPDPVIGRSALTDTKTATFGRLEVMTPYEFRVAKIVGDQMGPWSEIVAATTGRRVPSWSDLVVWDGIAELDITRVQMLTFTSLAAIFVVIKIIDESAIPTIPDSIILLMGLSNGLYVGGKFVGATK